eukprot:TRINITY_DN4775_c0_g1_i1.p1 TRINITY_DN4775_c0_g1~~TRINITY_DN4775_c0_g1_i1.p1  ORF type:complete len:1113 (-),score=304.93 TRINITY_DN4775_c0_g1_i1:63-3401(-)
MNSPSGTLRNSSAQQGNAISVPRISKEEAEAQLPKSIETLRDSQIGQKDKLEILNKLVELSESIKDLNSVVPIDQFVSSLRSFVVHTSKTLRTASLRVLRYYMKDDAFISEMLRQKVHFFVMRSLERDKQGEAERMQALKLVRRIMEVNCSMLPTNIIHSLVSISEHSEDNFSRVSIETICEITIRTPHLSAHCSGLKFLLNAMLDPNCAGIQESLMLAFVFLLNQEETRKYVRPALDIGLILAPLSDNFSLSALTKEQLTEKEKKWGASIKAIVIMLKNWTGLIALSSHPLGLKSLVNSLKLPCSELHDRIIDALFDIFRLSVAKNSNPFNKFSAQTQISDESGGGDLTGGLDLPSRTRGDRHNLLNNYLSALLISFIDANLIEALVELGSRRRSEQQEDKEQNSISIKATLLLGELLYLTNTLLPPAQCARVQTLPILMEYAASFTLDPRLRSRASSMVTNLHQYHHMKHNSSFYDFHLALIVTGANKWKRLKGRDKSKDKLDQVKMKMDFAMDVDQLKNKIQESQVLATKDFLRWKWEIIYDLLEGPLNNPALITFAHTKTVFIKRIMSFLRPTNKGFSRMPWSSQHLKYVRMACQLLEVLVSTDAGRGCLQDHQLIPEITELLKLELSPQKEDKKEQRLLSPEKVLKTMAREYFTMLGTLSSTPRGLEVLMKFGVFKPLIELSELQGRDDLCHLIMTSLDYNTDKGDARVILAKALTSASKVVRYLATRHMRVLLRAGVQDFSEWGVEFLVKQLNDPDAKVAQIALNILDEACDEVECMEVLIAKKPPHLLKMGEAGKNLALRFLSRPSGFKYLESIGFIAEEMKLWREKLNHDYVINIESNLAEIFSPSLYKQRETESGDGVFLPPHFYGELARTYDGCAVLEESKHIPEFIECIKDPSALPIDRRAAIWVLGHIGASKTGFHTFIEKDNVHNLLVNIAEKSPNLSIRGTCFYALGMISKVEAGRVVLNGLGWESPNNLNSCISVPKDIRHNTFFKLPDYVYEGSFARSGHVEYPFESNTDLQKEILTSVTHLSNFISAESASRTLKRIKAQHPDQFASPLLVLQVFNLLGTYKFRLPVRRFIYDIFGDVNFNEEALAVLMKPTESF